MESGKGLRALFPTGEDSFFGRFAGRGGVSGSDRVKSTGEGARFLEELDASLVKNEEILACPFSSFFGGIAKGWPLTAPRLLTGACDFADKADFLQMQSVRLLARRVAGQRLPHRLAYSTATSEPAHDGPAATAMNREFLSV